MAKNTLKMGSSFCSILMSIYAFRLTDWSDHTKYNDNIVSTTLGVLLAVLGVAIAVYEIIDDRYDKLYKLTQRFKEFKIYKNISIGNAYTGLAENTAQQEFVTIKGYIYELRDYFSKKEIKLLKKQKLFTEKDIELMDFYDKSPKIILFKNHKDIHNKLMESTIFSNEFN